MRHFDGMFAIWTFEDVMAQPTGFTKKHFNDIYNNADSQHARMPQGKAPPIPVVQEDVF